MRDRIDDPRLPSREDIAFQRLMDEVDESDLAETLAEQGIRRAPDPSPEEMEAMAEAYFNPSPEEIQRQRLLKLQCDLDALEAEAEEDEAEDAN